MSRMRSMGPYGARPYKGPSPGPKVSGPGPEAPLLADPTEKSSLAAPKSVSAAPSKPFFGRIGKSSFENQFKFNRPTFFLQEISSTNLNSKGRI